MLHFKLHPLVKKFHVDIPKRSCGQEFDNAFQKGNWFALRSYREDILGPLSQSGPLAMTWNPVL